MEHHQQNKKPMTHKVTLTEFGAQQYRALLISKLGLECLKVGINGIAIVVPASNYWPHNSNNAGENPKGLPHGADNHLIHPAVRGYRKMQTSLRKQRIEDFKEVLVDMDCVSFTKSAVARKLGFKRESATKFILKIERI